MLGKGLVFFVEQFVLALNEVGVHGRKKRGVLKIYIILLVVDDKFLFFSRQKFFAWFVWVIEINGPFLVVGVLMRDVTRGHPLAHETAMEESAIRVHLPVYSESLAGSAYSSRNVDSDGDGGAEPYFICEPEECSILYSWWSLTITKSFTTGETKAFTI